MKEKERNRKFSMMPRPNLNFVVGLGVTITTLLDSTRPKHYNTKILQASFLILSFARSGSRKATQKFPNFVVES
jgi:hypothetical protein